MSRIQLGHPYGQTPSNTFADFDWARENRQMLLEQYGPSILLIYEKQVIGQGDTIDAAIVDAESRLAADAKAVTPITYFLSERSPLRLTRVKAATRDSK